MLFLAFILVAAAVLAQTAKGVGKSPYLWFFIGGFAFGIPSILLQYFGAKILGDFGGLLAPAVALIVIIVGSYVVGFLFYMFVRGILLKFITSEQLDEIKLIQTIQYNLNFLSDAELLQTWKDRDSTANPSEESRAIENILKARKLLPLN